MTLLWLILLTLEALVSNDMLAGETRKEAPLLSMASDGDSSPESLFFLKRLSA